MCVQRREVVLSRHQVKIATEQHRLGAGSRLRGIPDQRLDRAGPLSGDHIPFGIDAFVGARIVVMLHHPKAHRMRTVGHGKCEVRLLSCGGQAGEQQRHGQDLDPRHLFHPDDQRRTARLGIAAGDCLTSFSFLAMRRTACRPWRHCREIAIALNDWVLQSPVQSLTTILWQRRLTVERELRPSL